jgi:hypothetical protein
VVCVDNFFAAAPKTPALLGIEEIDAMENKTISPSETATRLSKAGCPTSESSVRRWCSQGFGIRLMGRWRIPETRVAELERKLCAAGNCQQVPTCKL